MSISELKARAKGRPVESTEKGYILLYAAHSKSGKVIQKGLGLGRLLEQQSLQHVMNALNGSTTCFTPQPEHKKLPVLINWGNSPPNHEKLDTITPTYFNKVINTFGAVNIAGNKINFFKAMIAADADGPRIPEFTQDIEEAKRWGTSGKIVIGRKARGSSGQDISFFSEDPETFLSSQFWSVYKKKRREYRVHIFDGKVLLVQQKVLPPTDPDGNSIPKEKVDFRVRTHRTGFIFKRNDVVTPDDVLNQAVRAFEVLAKKGLTFGAVDVIWNEHEKKAYVLEINTAPGLEGTTIDDYTKAFANYIG